MATLIPSQGVVCKRSTTALAAQSEVVTCRFLQFHPSTTVPIGASNPQGRAHEVSGLSYGPISKCWLCTRVCYAFLNMKKKTRTNKEIEVHAEKERMSYINTRRFLYRYVIRSSSLLSLSPFRRIIVPVNLHSRHNPKQSSKAPFLSVSHYLKM